MQKETFQRIVELLEGSELTNIEVAQQVGVHPTAVAKIARGQHHYQQSDSERRRRRNYRGNSRQGYLPSPEEIRAECSRLRARRQTPTHEDDARGWVPPMYSDRLVATS